MDSPRSRPGSKPVPDIRPQGADDEARPAVDATPVEGERLGATRIIGQDPSRSNTALRSDTVLPGLPLPEAKEPVILGDFRLLQKLGEGAMGTVYLAQQISFDNREVALKVLFRNVGENPKLVKRLEREGRTMGRLDHPNIVRGFGLYAEEGWQCIAMEYVAGESLQKVLIQLGRLNIGDALHITLACARALLYAHEEGLIHRDVKPDNVLINLSGEVKLTDLGMVKDEDEEMSLTQTGHAVGTPWYMPLEQARNAKETDGRCDIYALGCMLYCMLTGQPPFVGRTLVEVIQAKEKGTFPPARQANAEVPEKLDLIIFKMTAKEPRYRYSSCGEVVEALEGLNLTSPRLSYLFPEAQPVRRSAQPRSMPALATKEGPAAATPKSAAVEEKADVWFVRIPSEAGPGTTKRMSTAEVVRLIESKNFNVEITASKNAKEGFRSLATFREFQPLVLGRASKSAVDEKTARYRSLYKKIDEQERQREQTRDAKPVVSNFRYWMGNLARFAVYGLLVYGALYVLFVLLPRFLRD